MGKDNYNKLVITSTYDFLHSNLCMNNKCLNVSDKPFYMLYFFNKGHLFLGERNTPIGSLNRESLYILGIVT